MQTHFFIPTSPLDSGSTYYFVIRNPSDIGSPASSSVGGAAGGGIFNGSTNQFVDISTVNCADGASWSAYALSLPEESVACGGYYRGELPTKLQILGQTYDIVVIKQAGSSPSFSGDSVVSTITHNVGDGNPFLDVSYVPGGATLSSRIYVNTGLNGVSKSCTSTPTFTAPSPAVSGSVYNPVEGVYYCDIDISGMAQDSFIPVTVSASLTSQVWNGTSWQGGSGDPHFTLTKSIGLARGGDIESSINQILNKPTIE